MKHLGLDDSVYAVRNLGRTAGRVIVMRCACKSESWYVPEAFERFEPSTGLRAVEHLSECPPDVKKEFILKPYVFA
jgi:hypothetical protein